ncbi:MAG: CHASE2 domain-containing protein [Armatimonadota bacterium]|jgi:adenylate cyclase
MRRQHGLRVIGIAIGLGAGLFAAWLCDPSTPAGLLSQVLYRAELSLYDYRLAWAPGDHGQSGPVPSRDITLVTIDEESFSQPELSMWPWPRRFHARVLRRLGDAGARVIGMDIILAGVSGDPECPPGEDPFLWTPPLSPDDEALVAGLRAAGNVVLALEVVHEAVAGTGAAGELIVANFPLPEFEEASLALGAVSLPADLDGTVRRYLTSVTHQDAVWPSMAVCLAALRAGVGPAELAARILVAARSDHPALPLEDFLINYRAPVGQGFVRIPYYRVLSGEFDHALVADRIVLLGATARSLQDLHATPVSLRGIPGTSQKVAAMPGVEVIAAATDTILRSAWIVPAPVWMAILLTAVLSMLMGALVCWLRPLRGLLLGWLPLVALALILTFEAMWTRRMWLPLVPLLLGVTLTFVLDTVYLELTSWHAERRLRRAWSMRVAPEVLRVILADPELARVAGRRVIGTVFFSDLQEFTTFCSTSAPEEVVNQVNRYLSVVTEVILAHGGTVHKFIGDGVMAVFGDPVPHDDHATRAVAASLEIQERIAHLRAAAAPDEWPIIVRIGLHTGELVAGDVGSERMLEYTVMGETVSVASRLESANKELGTSILMSDVTAKLIAPDYAPRSLGRIPVRGLAEPIDVFSVDPPAAAQMTPPSRPVDPAQ